MQVPALYLMISFANLVHDELDVRLLHATLIHVLSLILDCGNRRRRGLRGTWLQGIGTLELLCSCCLCLR